MAEVRGMLIDLDTLMAPGWPRSSVGARHVSEGLFDLLTYARDAQLPTGALTEAPREQVKGALAREGVLAFFDVVCDAGLGEAIELLGTVAKRTLLITQDSELAARAREGGLYAVLVALVGAHETTQASFVVVKDAGELCDLLCAGAL